MEVKTTCAGNGSAGSLYNLRLVYTVNKGTVTASLYLKRNDGYANSFYNLDPVVYCYVQCGSNKQAVSRSVDTRNGVEVLLRSYTFTGLTNGTYTISGGFSNTGVSQITGGFISTSVQVITATPPTSAWFSKIEADTSYMNYSYYKAATDGHHNYGQGRIKLTCASSGATGEAVKYRIAYRIQKEGSPWVFSDDLPSNTASYSFSFGKDGGGYFSEGDEVHFEVKAYNSAGAVDYGSSTCITANKKPTVPSNISSTTAIKGNGATITWNASSSAAGLAVKYMYSTNVNGGSWSSYKEVSTNSVTIDTSSFNHGDKIGFKVHSKDAWALESADAVNNNAIQMLTPPNAPSISLSAYAEGNVVEGDVGVAAYATANYPAGTIKYRISYKFTGSTQWIYSGWQTSTNFTIQTTEHRGKALMVYTQASNDAGESPWSEEKSVNINSLPSVPVNVSCTEQYPVNTARITWSPSSDNEGQHIDYAVYKYKNNSWMRQGITAETYYDVDIQDIAYGGEFHVTVDSIDSMGAVSHADRHYTFTRLPVPSVPVLTSENKVCESTYTLSWRAVQFAGNSGGEYIIESSTNGNSWTRHSSTTSTSATINVTDIARGSTKKFRVIASNKAVSGGLRSDYNGASHSFVTVTRNTLPSVPSDIIPNGGVFVNTISLSWTCSSSNSLTYNIYIKRDNGEYVKLGSTNNTTYRWARPSGDADKIKYKFKIEAVDSLGASTSAETNAFIMPKYPTAPTNLLPNTPNARARGTLNISWNASDFDGYNGSYFVTYYINDTALKTVNITATSHSLDLNGIASGSKIHYTVYAENEYLMRSSTVRMNGYLIKKEPPTAPQIIAPSNSLGINSKRPRIIIKAGVGSDGENVTVTVTVGSNSYNSALNASMFSRQTTSTGEYIIFKMPEAFGTSTAISVVTDDGGERSASVSRTYKSSDTIDKAVSGETYVDSDYCNSIKQTLTNMLSSYGATSVTMHTVARNGNILKTYFDEYLKAAQTLENKINSYHAGNKFAVSINTSVDSKVLASDINKAINVINSGA